MGRFKAIKQPLDKPPSGLYSPMFCKNFLWTGMICWMNHALDLILLFKLYFISKENGLDNRLLSYIKSSPGLVGLVLYIIYIIEFDMEIRALKQLMRQLAVV